MVFPDFVYIDTNSILDIMEQRPHGQLTEEFIKETVRRDGMITWSQHTLDEVIDFIHVDQYIKYARSNNIQGNNRKAGWKIAEDRASDKDSALIAKNVVSKVDQLVLYLEQFGEQTDVDESELTLLTKKVYETYGGNRKDSKHIAAANLSGVNNILTQDGGFIKYPVNIYGSSKQLVQNSVNGQSPKPFIDLRETFGMKQIIIENQEDENAS